MRIWPFRKRRKPVEPVVERVTVDDLARMAQRGELARAVVTPPPAPRASADRVRATVAQLPGRPLGSAGGTARRDAAPARQTAAAVLVLDDHQRVTVSGGGLIGRDPASAHPDGGYAHMIALEDPDKLLSRTHLEFGFGAEGSLWVLDTASANGVELQRPGFPATIVPPAQRTVVQPGDVVVFGGHTLRAEPQTALVGEAPLG
ncbi:FHA domain-containing protein [Curtobacterium sp. VKM Ac-2884]|uniref:FHA domain-containing protein n=1 Tax=Curtobacterium sp. VKM Ac-2884 TaxID=2783818 RepID=UPI00188A124C|nr:FHA domain-containing protein [Curtobacterium sp. VKM Ac-2884]MBF4603654.1 FHA domain-containing protein [Curtobacterium sp. VKM Ac-2884]